MAIDLTFPTQGGDYDGINVIEQQDNSFLIQNTDGSTITGQTLRLASADGSAIKAEFVSKDPTVLKDSLVEGSDAKDILTIGGATSNGVIKTFEGDDRVKTEGDTEDSAIRTGSGADRSVNKGDVENSTFNLGAGDDTAKFLGDVNNSTIQMGKGADRLIFGGDVTDTKVFLGDDTDIDRIEIGENADFKGLQIVGASEGDLLIIGSSEYVYDGKAWINSDGDVKEF